MDRVAARTSAAIERAAPRKNGDRRTALRVNNRTDLPAADNPVEDTSTIQQLLALAKRKFVNDTRVEYVRHVEVGANPFQLRSSIVNVRLKARLGSAGRIGQNFAERVVHLPEDAVLEA